MRSESTRKTERWLPVPVPGYDDLYEVSDLGRIRSLKKRNKWLAGRIIKCFPNSDGYASVTMKSNSVNYRQPVHKLVLVAFIGPCPPGLQCRHLDGDRWNATLSNLEWNTYQVNQDDIEAHGNRLRGSRQPNSKLTESKVRKIRTLVSIDRLDRKQIARRFGVHVSTIHRVVSRTAYWASWTHVQ